MKDHQAVTCSETSGYAGGTWRSTRPPARPRGAPWAGPSCSQPSCLKGEGIRLENIKKRLSASNWPDSSLTIDFVEVYLANLVHHVLVVKCDEAEATMPVGHLVVGQHRLLHLEEDGLRPGHVQS